MIPEWHRRWHRFRSREVAPNSSCRPVASNSLRSHTLWLRSMVLAIGTLCIVPPVQAQQAEGAPAALASGDTSAAVHDLERVVTSQPLSPAALGAFFLVDWIARSGAQDEWAVVARTVRDQYLAAWMAAQHEAIPPTGALEDAVRIVLKEWTDVGRSTRRQPITGKLEMQRRAKSSLDSVAAVFETRAPAIAAAARWVRVWHLLQVLDRAAADVPRVPATVLPVCPSGCNNPLTPPKEYQLAMRLSAEPTASALAELVGLFGELERAPEPLNWLGARAHVAVCALLLEAPAAGCWPRPDRLVGRDSAEVAVMTHVFQGRHGLASQVIDARPAWFAPLAAQRDLLDAPDSVLRVDTTWQIGRTFITSRLVAAPQPSSMVQPADVFWRLAWPLYLQPHNERFVVHCGRLLLADVVRRLTVNGEPLFAPVGDPVRIVRSGVPLAVVQLVRSPRSMISGRMTTTRVYVSPAMHETAPGQGALSVPWAPIDLALAAADRPRYSAATGFVSEDFRRLSMIDYQLVHYIRAGHRRFDVYTSWTPPALCTTPRPLLGLVWLDSMLQEQHRDIRIDLAAHSRTQFSTTLEAGTHLYSLELLDRGCHVAGRSRYWIKVPPSEGAFISDLMLADRLFTGDTNRVAWRVVGDPIATMSASRWVRAGAPVRLYWEVYGVTTTAAEADRLAVTFAVVDTKRQRVPVSELAALADQTRRTRGALELTYNLSVPPGTDPLGCGIAFDMPADARGLYVARVSVTDPRTGKAATAERAFLVLR